MPSALSSGMGRLTAADADCLAERALRTRTNGIAVEAANDAQAGTAIWAVSEIEGRTADLVFGSRR